MREAPDVRVRSGRTDDLDAIVTVYNPYVTATAVTFETVPVRSEDRAPWLAEHLRNGPHRIVVAEEGSGRLVGWATTSPFRPRAAYATTVESSVYCEPRSVGRGIGSRLYEELFRSIQDQDVERIVAGVTLPNPASLALHRRFGFRPVGVFTRVGRKFDQYWDVQWLERPLRLPPPPSSSTVPRTDPGPPSGRAGAPAVQDVVSGR